MDTSAVTNYEKTSEQSSNNREFIKTIELNKKIFLG